MPLLQEQLTHEHQESPSGAAADPQAPLAADQHREELPEQPSPTRPEQPRREEPAQAQEQQPPGDCPDQTAVMQPTHPDPDPNENVVKALMPPTLMPYFPLPRNNSRRLSRSGQPRHQGLDQPRTRPKLCLPMENEMFR